MLVDFSNFHTREQRIISLCDILKFCVRFSFQTVVTPSILYVYALFSSSACTLDPGPFDCREAYVLGCRWSGVYTIDPGCGKSFSVWCDMNNGGGWTVFQRRRDGSENFYRGWTEYENGFGNVKGEHWLVLKKISCLTSVGVTKLRIDLIDFAGHSKYACYDRFYVGTPRTNYRLAIGGYKNWGMGTAGGSMTGSRNHNGMQFTTKDRDNDRYSGNCASHHQGAWWYSNVCGYSSLNGLYHDDQNNYQGVVWYDFNATAPSWRTLRYSEMKLKWSGWKLPHCHHSNPHHGNPWLYHAHCNIWCVCSYKGTIDISLIHRFPAKHTVGLHHSEQ